MELTIENYFSQEANMEYMSASQYLDFAGAMGKRGCEARAMATLQGKYERPISDSLLQGKYADAYFGGTLEQLKTEFPCLFSGRGPTKGELKSVYRDIETLIERIERDSYFMSTLQGDSQRLFTADWLGTKWKVLVDFYHQGKAIVDLKIMKDILESFYVKDFGRMIWLQYWGYDFQGAIYQKIVEIVTGELLPFFISAASKKDQNIEVIGIDDKTLSECRYEIENNIKRILQVKSGEVEPDRCGLCKWCLETKVLSGPVHYSELSV